mgnify:CR=1 FL=1
MLEWFEWTGCLLGILGALLVALKSAHAHWAWLFWLVSNVCWTAFGLFTDNVALALQQGALMITSGIGLWHWLIKPRVFRSRNETLEVQ